MSETLVNGKSWYNNDGSKDADNIVLSLTNSTSEVLNMAEQSLPNSISTYKLCSVDGCDKKHKGKGFCGKHLYRLQKNGDPLIVRNNHGKDKTPEEYFWSRVAVTANPDKCWLWLKSCDRDGYGHAFYEGRLTRAHHLSWFFIHKARSVHHLLHSCHNPRCVNPNHLREGTHQENMRDMVEAKRQQKGEKNGLAKLTAANVLTIKQQLKNGESFRQIGDQYGVSHATIYAIKAGKSWKYLEVKDA